MGYHSFTKAFSTLLPEEFETRVLDAFQVKKIFVGFDYHYGFKGQGNTETLKEIPSICFR